MCACMYAYVHWCVSVCMISHNDCDRSDYEYMANPILNPTCLRALLVIHTLIL